MARVFAHRDDARARGVQGQSFDGKAADARGRDGRAHRLHQSIHVIGVALRSVVGIVAFAVKLIGSDAGAKPSLDAVENRRAHAQGSEVHAGDDAQSRSAMSRPAGHACRIGLFGFKENSRSYSEVSLVNCFFVFKQPL